MNLRFEKIIATAKKGDKDSQYKLASMYQFGNETPIDLEKATKWYKKAAEQGHQSALSMLKTIKGSEESYKESDIDGSDSVNWYKYAASGGNPEAQLWAYENSDLMNIDDHEAIAFLLKSAYSGYEDAQIIAADLILDGVIGADEGIFLNHPDDEENEWIALAAETGDLRAQNNQSITYFIESKYSDGDSYNHYVNQAFKWTLMASKQGDDISQFILGRMYAKGQGIAKSLKDAAKWYKKSAEQGFTCAQFELGSIYAHDKGTPKNYKEAVKWFKKAAEKSKSPDSLIDIVEEGIYDKCILNAKYNLGLMHDNGKGVLKNHKEAVKWYKKAAKQSLAEEKENLKSNKIAIQRLWREGGLLLDEHLIKIETAASIYHNLAKKYYHGEGVLKDNKKASSWFLKAAEKYDVRSQYMLHMHAKDLNINAEDSIDWLYKSAGKDFLKRGYAKSQYLVGTMYFENRESDSDIMLNQIFWAKITLQESLEDNMSKSKFWIGRAYENSDKAVREKAEEFWNKNKLWRYKDFEYKGFVAPNDQELLKETPKIEDDLKQGKRLVNGDGVLKDPIKAIEYFIKASKNGHHKAETALELGVIYFEESSIKSIAKSKKWIKKAFESSNAITSKKAEDFWNKHELWKL